MMKILISEKLNPPILQSRTINVLQVWLCSWCTYHSMELKFEYTSGMTNYVYSDVKFFIRDDPILQNPSQEPSTSSKCDCVLDNFLTMLGSWQSAYNSIMTYHGYSWYQFWYQRWSSTSKLQSGTIDLLQLWLCLWCTFNHTRE